MNTSLSRKNHENESDPFLSPVQPNYPQWIGILIMETFFLAFGSYLLTAFIYFTIKNTSDSNSSSIPGGRGLQRIRKFLLILLIIYATTSVFKFCLAQWIYWGPPISNSTEQCALTGALFQAVHSIGLTSLFLFLWLRQHSLQQGNKYISSPSPCIVRFSWSLLVIIIVAGFAGTIGVIFTNTPDLFLYIRGTNICSYAPPFGLNSVIVYSGYTLIVAMQVCILSLFILVLNRSRKERTTVLNTKSVTESASQRRVHILIRNCTIAAAISSISNVIVVLVDVIAKGTIAHLVVYGTWDIDNAISLGSIVFCFSNWKELLLPWSCLADRFKPAFTSQATSSGIVS